MLLFFVGRQRLLRLTAKMKYKVECPERHMILWICWKCLEICVFGLFFIQERLLAGLKIEKLQTEEIHKRRPQIRSFLQIYEQLLKNQSFMCLEKNAKISKHTIESCVKKKTKNPVTVMFWNISRFHKEVSKDFKELLKNLYFFWIKSVKLIYGSSKLYK